MAWVRSHQNAYRKAVKSFSTSPWYFSAMGLPQSAYAKKGRRPQFCYKRPPASRDSHRRHSRAGGRGPHPRGREQPAWSAEKEKESESDDGGIECDVSNMEITEELRQYFAQTERHQEERRKCSPPRSAALPRPASGLVSCPRLFLFIYLFWLPWLLLVARRIFISALAGMRASQLRHACRI